MRSFKEKLFYKNSKRIKLIQFWCAWCGSCINTKHLEEFHMENYSVEVYRLNVDENHDYATKHSIVVLPTYIFFKNLKPIFTLIGEQTKTSLNLAYKSLKQN